MLDLGPQVFERRGVKSCYERVHYGEANKMRATREPEGCGGKSSVFKDVCKGGTNKLAPKPPPSPDWF